MKPRFILVFESALEDGIEGAWSLAHKHGEPTEQQLKAAMYERIMQVFYERFEFPEDTFV